MTISVQYIQLNDNSCIRETFHDNNRVSVETLSQHEMPFQVQRLMLMKTGDRSVHEPALNHIIKMSPQEVYRMIQSSHEF